MSTLPIPIAKHEFVGTPARKFRVDHKVKPGVSASFSFDDQTWRLLGLLRPNKPDSHAQLNFGLIEPWLRDDCKRFVATRWLQEGCSLSDIRRAFYCLRHLGLALRDVALPDGCRSLRRRHSRVFVEYLEKADLAASYNADIQTTINAFAKWILEEYTSTVGDDFDFELVIPKDLLKRGRRPAAWKQNEEKFIDRTTLQQILDACAEDELAYATRVDLLAKGEFTNRRGTVNLRSLWIRAIYAQAIKLAVCVGRRSIAIGDLAKEPKTRQGEFGSAQWGVWINFFDSKERNDEDPVICIGTYGEIALDSIEKAQRLTQPIRDKHPGHPATEYLFVLPGGPRRMSNQGMNEFLWNVDNTGLSQRYQILDVDGAPRHLTTHNFRTTHHSNIILGGAPLHVAQQAGAHSTSDTTARHYAVRGDEAQMRKLDEELRSGALAGTLVDPPPSVLEERIGKRQAEFWAKRKRILVPNRFGYCALPISDGPCVTSEDCIAGDPESGEPCLYHVLSPDAIPAIEEGLEVAEFNVQQARALGLDAWEENQLNVVRIYRQALDQCHALAQKLERSQAFAAKFAPGLPVLQHAANRPVSE
ncbi:MAG TPA: hypothetical protein VFJ82_03060 [Longimicrobium sp.]|nr:hypothetical protein [Longimicrobium sp.]